MGLFDWFKKSTRPIPPGPLPNVTKPVMIAKGFSTTNEARIARRQAKMLKMGMEGDSIRVEQFTDGDATATQNILSAYTNAVRSRQEYMLAAEEIRSFWTADAILNIVAEDVLNHDEDSELVDCTSKNPKFQEAIDQFCADVDIEEMFRDILPDCLDAGEYTLSLRGNHEEKTGVVEIVDDIDQTNTVALYEQGKATQFLMLKNGTYTVESGASYVHFCISSQKIRIKIQDTLQSGYAFVEPQRIDPEVAESLPDYVRVGRPFFLNRLGKLRELEILETMVIASKFNQMTQSRFVGIEVPNGANPKVVEATLLHFEQVLNKQSGVDAHNKQVTAADVVSAMGRTRCWPIYAGGTAPGGKGTPSVLNLREDTAVDDIVKSADVFRSLLMSSLGIPPSFLFGGNAKGDENGSNRTAEIRIQGRYARMLRRVQTGLARGLKQLLLTHLVNLGHEPEDADVEVRFRQSIADVSGLESLEMLDSKVAITKNIMEFFNETLLANEFWAKAIDPAKLYKFAHESLMIVTGGEPLFKEEYAGTDEEGNETPINPETKKVVHLDRTKFIGNVMQNFQDRRALREDDIIDDLEDDDPANAEFS